jgi:predicted ATPase/DNA-binding SARP family transcriptional activator
MGIDRPVEFRALGTIELRRRGVEIAEVLGQPKRFSLFAYLALTAKRLSRRDTLLALLWPDLDDPRARHALRQGIYYLRSHIDEELFVIRGDDIGIDASRLWCDVTALDRAWEAGDMEAVADLYRGELLEGFHPSAADNELQFWLDQERSRLRERAAEAHRRLAERAEAEGDPGAAVRWATARREILPADEEALLALMTLLDKTGRPASAIEEYRRFVAWNGYAASGEAETLAHELEREADLGRLARRTPPPTPPTPLIGRRRLVEQACQMLEGGVRLLTLTGPGGVGKTRLAIEIVDAAGGAFEDGVAWTSLASLRDAERVPDAVAEAVGLEPRASGSAEERLTSWLAARESLLVLDNFEHLPEAARFVGRLVRVCPLLSVIVTSRSPLKLRAEQELGVPPLSLPDPMRPLGAELPFGSEAVALFVERVRAGLPDFRLTESNAGSVIEICRRLDGLPLAIELAAPRLKIMSPAALAARLERVLPLLTRGHRDLPERQRAIEDTIRWSVELLDLADREVLFGLSVFCGGCDIEAVEAVAGAATGAESEVLDRLTELVDASLLQRTPSADGDVRFTMLEAIREYGRAELERTKRGDDWRDAHARHFAAWIETGGKGNYCSPGEPAWLDRVAANRENLEAAMEWSLARREVECAGRIAAGSAHFWCARGRLAEGREWMDRVLAAGTGVPADLRARCLSAAAQVLTYQGMWGEAIAAYEEVVSYRRASRDPLGLASALHNLGQAQREAGRLREAVASLSEALALAEEMGDDLRVGFALTGLGSIAREEGRLAEARSTLEAALERARSIGHESLIALGLRELADVARDGGDDEAALRLLEQAAIMLEGLDRPGDLAATIERIGELREGENPDIARGLYARALGMHRDGGYLWGAARVLGRFARLALEDGAPDRCAELLGAVEALSATEAARLADIWERARAALGDGTAAACRTAGRVMGLDQLTRRVDELIPAVEIPHPAGAARTSAGAGSGGAPYGSG